MSYSDAGDRPAIPADIRRRVLVEAGHRCAIPTCRYIEVDIHHVIPWAQCQAHEYDNLIALCPNCHRRADRGEIDRKSLRLYKFNLRFAHDKFSNIEMDVLLDLNKAAPNQGLKWAEINLVLIKRLMDAGYIAAVRPQAYLSINGLSMAELAIYLTDQGREFCKELGLAEL